MLDLLIKNADIIDGSGKSAYKVNVGIKDGKIRIGERQALEEISADGLTLTPGFIDAHSHSDITLTDDFSSLSKLSQGITTHIGGNCSISMFPVKDNNDFLKFAKAYCTCPSVPEDITNLSSPESYAKYLRNTPLRLNMAYYTGMGSLRLYAMGYSDKNPNTSQLNVMKEMLGRAIDSGSLGLSTGLVYVPNCYSSKEEIIELLKVVKEHNGFYATHVRNESDHVIEAYDEALECAKMAGVPLFLSHFKAAGKRNWGKPEKILEKINQYIKDGMKITLDHYPYLAGMTSLNVSIPPEYRKDGPAKLAEYLEDLAIVHKIKERMSVPASDYENYVIACGGFDGVMVSSCPFDHSAEGKTITEYANEMNIEPFDAYISILRKNKGLGLGIYFHMCEDDLISIAKYPHTIIGTDALFGAPGENVHPRTFGTFAQGYDFYVNNKKILTSEEYIHRITGLSAERFGFNHKGLIADGYDADLVLMDLKELKPSATYKNSNLLCKGVKAVFVNGQKAYDGRNLTDAYAGKVIYHNKYNTHSF